MLSVLNFELLLRNLAYYAALVSEDARDVSHVLVLVPALLLWSGLKPIHGQPTFRFRGMTFPALILLTRTMESLPTLTG